MADKQLTRLIMDIQDLRNKLLDAVTKNVKPKMESDRYGKERNDAELKRKAEVRDLKNMLKEKLQIYELLDKAEEVENSSEFDKRVSLVKDINNKGKK